MSRIARALVALGALGLGLAWFDLALQMPRGWLCIPVVVALGGVVAAAAGGEAGVALLRAGLWLLAAEVALLGFAAALRWPLTVLGTLVGLVLLALPATARDETAPGWAAIVLASLSAVALVPIAMWIPLGPAYAASLVALLGGVWWVARAWRSPFAPTVV